MIRLTIPSIDQADLDAVRDVLKSGFLVQGPKVAEFERAVAECVGTEHAIAVSSCTAALHLALLVLDVGPGDHVAVAAYSWPATANVIVLCGAEPVFVDIRPDTFNMDPDALQATLKANKVKAILPVHTFGNMADMPRIMELADRYGVPVVEDAACALGAEMHGRKAGAWGRMGCFSFHPRKAITTGEGGMITTNDSRLARMVRALRNHGQDPEAASPDFILAGFNYRMTEFQAALGNVQMTKLGGLISYRQTLASQYDALLKDSTILPPAVEPGVKHIYQSYVTRLPDDFPIPREELIASLRNTGFETTIGTWNIPMTTYMKTRFSLRSGQFPVAESVFSRSVTLPLHQQLTYDDQLAVIAALSCDELSASRL